MRVLIADDHFIFRQGLRAMLGGLAADLTIDEAANLEEAMRCVAAAAPDLVLLDLKMPGMQGFAGIGQLRRGLAAPILVLTASEDSNDVYEALAAGANGYLPKSAAASTMQDALRLVLAGGIYVPRDLLTAAEGPPRRSAEAARLTGRQREVLELVADGHSNKEIGHRIGASEGTIKAHVTAIMRALGARNRVQMLLAAQRAGLAKG